MAQQFDAVIIGTGQSGPSLAARIAKEGQKVAIIERGRFGGTCVNTGCIPTKAMVASARTVHVAKRAADFGIRISGSIVTDMKKVQARKDRISGASRSGVENMLTNTENITVFRNHARFLTDHQVSADQETLTAPRIFINVGGRAVIPNIPGLSNIPYLTNSSILEIDSLPAHLIIMGGGYIGLEFSQMFRRFGSEVTIVERGSRLLPREDPDISDAIREILEQEGIQVHLNTTIAEFCHSGENILIRTHNPGVGSLEGTHVLVATGRKPNTDDLGLETTGIKRNEHGFIDVNDELETAVSGVWAIGDCNGRGAFTHTSYNDYEIVAANLFDNEKRRVTDRITAYNVYIDPPLGHVGLTEEEARQSGKKILIGRRPMSKVGRAVEKGETQGFMKVLVDADSNQILGASILGTDGDEAIHCILDTMYAKAPYTVLQHAMHIHPTVSELIPTMLGSLEPLK